MAARSITRNEARSRARKIALGCICAPAFLLNFVWLLGGLSDIYDSERRLAGLLIVSYSVLSFRLLWALRSRSGLAMKALFLGWALASLWLCSVEVEATVSPEALLFAFMGVIYAAYVVGVGIALIQEAACRRSSSV